MERGQKYLSIAELFDLRGKVAVVTGGAAGMGFAFSRRLGEAGAAVLIADINPEIGKQRTKELAAAGYKVDFVKCDVTRESDVANMVDVAVKTFGGLDIMVNNKVVHHQDVASAKKQELIFFDISKHIAEQNGKLGISLRLYLRRKVHNFGVEVVGSPIYLMQQSRKR